MSNYRTWNWKDSYPNPISADSGTISSYLDRNEVTPQAPNAGDLLHALEWLALYEAYDETDTTIQAFANVIAFLDMTATSKINRASLNEAKRIYAKQHGIKFNQVRKIKKG